LFRGGFEPESPYVSRADVVLGIGCKMFVDMSFSKTPNIPRSAKVIHFHSDPCEIAKIYPEEISVLCEARSGITALLDALRPMLTDDLNARYRKRLEDLGREKEEQMIEREKEIQAHWNETPIHLARLIRELNRTVDKDAIIVDEAIRSSRTLLKFYDFEVPGTFQRSSAGALGWGVPAALGVKLANPKRQVIAFVGDGSFLFTIQSLWTAARYNISVVIVVCNNRQYRAVRDGSLRYKGVAARTGNFIATDLKDPEIEFGHIAQGFGVWSRKINDPENIKPSLKEALDLGKPAVLDVRIA